jgi:hypothetical protein
LLLFCTGLLGLNVLPQLSTTVGKVTDDDNAKAAQETVLLPFGVLMLKSLRSTV